MIPEQEIARVAIQFITGRGGVSIIDLEAEKLKIVEDTDRVKQEQLIGAVRETLNTEGAEVAFETVMQMFSDLGPLVTALIATSLLMRLVRDGNPTTED